MSLQNAKQAVQRAMNKGIKNKRFLMVTAIKAAGEHQLTQKELADTIQSAESTVKRYCDNPSNAFGKLLGINGAARLESVVSKMKNPHIYHMPIKATAGAVTLDDLMGFDEPDEQEDTEQDGM